MYGKEPVEVIDSSGQRMTVMAYTMNSPYKECPAPPSQGYLQGILDGCRQNGIDPAPIRAEVNHLLKKWTGKQMLEISLIGAENFRE